MHKKPTRIILKPKKEGESVRSRFEIHCDNGVIYSMTGLAKAVGVSQSTMAQRFKDYRWDDPRIMSSKIQKQVKETKGGNLVVEGDLVGKFNGRRTIRERRENLDKIPSATEYEKRL